MSIVDAKLESIRSEPAVQTLTPRYLSEGGAECLGDNSPRVELIDLYHTRELLSVRGLDRSRKCSCPGHKEEGRWEISSALRCTISSFSRHLPSCSLHVESKRELRISAAFNFHLVWNAAGLAVTLKVIRGAGACVPLWNLTCQRIVLEDSPAFELLDYCNPRTQLPRSPLAIGHIRQQLDRLFRSGKASPRDTVGNGYTLLQVRSPVLLDIMVQQAINTYRPCYYLQRYFASSRVLPSS